MCGDCVVVDSCTYSKFVFDVGAFGFERQNPPEGQNIITTTRSHSNRAVTEAVEACQPSEIVRVGGAGHKVWGQHHTMSCVGRGCCSVGRVSDRHVAEAGSIPRGGKGFFSQSQLSAQTLTVSVAPQPPPHVRPHVLASVRTLKIL